MVSAGSGTLFRQPFGVFLQDVDKNNVPPDPPWYGTSWQVLLELTFSDVVTAAGGQWLRPDGKKCFVPLPRTVYLVINRIRNCNYVNHYHNYILWIPRIETKTLRNERFRPEHEVL